MRTVLLIAFVLVSGCSGLEEREPMPVPGGLLSPRPRPAYSPTLDVRASAKYEVTDPAHLSPARYSPAVTVAAVASHASELFNGRSGPHNDSHLDLETDVIQANLHYEGQRGVWGLKLFFTIFFFPIDFPNYFIASDRFALTLTARWRLIEKEQVVAEGTCQGKQIGYFGDFSRGWYFVGYLRMPSPLNAGEWQEIADQLIPGAQDALAEALVLDVEKALASPKK
jgi:hypothetical protein